jgi:hypothetical protein
MACLLALGLDAVQAQGKLSPSLSGTSWLGPVNIPDPLTCLLKIGKDTARLLYVDDREIEIQDDVFGSRVVTGKDSATIEVMTWRLSGDTIELHKVSGGSPCGPEKGQYRVVVAGGKLKFILIQDPCSARPNALKEEMAEVK